MIKFIEDIDPRKIKKLPLVVELRKGDEKIYFSIENEKAFYDEYLEKRTYTPLLTMSDNESDIYDLYAQGAGQLHKKSYPGPFPPVEHMEFLIEKFGKEMSKEDFEKGSVALCVQKKLGNKGYSEYRFRSPENT